MAEKMQFVLTPEDIGVIIATHISQKHCVDCKSIEYKLENVKGSLVFTQAVVEAAPVIKGTAPKEYTAAERMP